MVTVLKIPNELVRDSKLQYLKFKHRSNDGVNRKANMSFVTL